LWPQLDCAAFDVIACGVPGVADGTTVGEPSRVDHYACSPHLHSGPERSYGFSVTEPGVIYAQARSADPGLDAILLATCDEGNCLTSRSGCIESPARGDYRVVIDGRDGAAADYSLELFCLRRRPGTAGTPATTAPSPASSLPTTRSPC